MGNVDNSLKRKLPPSFMLNRFPSKNRKLRQVKRKNVSKGRWVFFYFFGLTKGEIPKKGGGEDGTAAGITGCYFFPQRAPEDENALDITEGFELEYIL